MTLDIKSEKCNFLINGAWNPAIIHPEWLQKTFPELFDKKDKFTIHVTAGAIQSVKYQCPKIFIEPTIGRLSFVPIIANDDTWKYISDLSQGILSKLHHTPTSAAGCNFVYELKESMSYKLFDEAVTEGEKDFYDANDIGLLTKRKIQHTVPIDNYELNIIYEITKESRIVQYNFHYRSPHVIIAAKNIVDNYKQTLELNSKLIGE